MIKKKAISAVITNVLLVLVAVIGVSLIAAFIIPMVRDSLKGGTSCFDLRDYAKIVSGDFTCYNSSLTSIMIERGMENFSIEGFVVSIFKEGEAKRYDLIPGTTVVGVKMKGESDDTIKIPNPGEAKTYIFNISNGNRAELAVINKGGKICSVGEYTIPVCLRYP